MPVSSLPGPCERAVLVKTAGGEGVIFSPTSNPHPVDLDRSWSIALRAAVRVPVVWSTSDRQYFALVDDPTHVQPPRSAVAGVTYVTPVSSVLASPVERACPPPSIEDYMAVLEAGGSSHMQDTSTPIVLQAFALRVEQLSAHELYRITSLSGAIDDELSERIRRVSPGVEYSAMALYESVKRFHSADSLGERLLNTAYIAAAHVYSTHHQDGGGVALRSLMAQRMADPAVAEALTTALRPWVTVCGRLPGTEITPLIDPHAPSAIRDEQTVGMLQSMAPPPPVIKGPPGVRRLDQPPRPRRNTVIGDVTPPEDTSMARRRWWQRSRRPSAVAALVWNPTLDRHDAVLRDYLTFEIDPQLILAYPAAVDVHVPATRAFHEAAEYASALRTENGPTDTGHAEAYRLAVDALQAAWTEAKRHAHIVGRSYLDQAHARGLERISALLSHADSTDEPESNSYRSRAAELLKSQPAHRTTRAQSTLDHAVRTELTSG